MTITVQFEHVSKLYNLGLTRTSLPSLLGGWLRSKISRQTALAMQAEATSKQFWALDDVSFTLQAGESLALVGANGAGKTTILKLLANITKPTSGALTSNGQLSALIELGAGFHPDLTGRENIYLNGAVLGLGRKEIERRFDEIVAFSELDHFIDTPVKRYSSGMTVRLGFAVASCIQPNILLVDEVLAVGDAAFQQKCMKRIHALQHSGTSIIFVSHNFYLIQAVCQLGLYLEKGKVRNFAPIKEIISEYEQDLHRQRALKFVDEKTTPAVTGNGLEITRVEMVDAADPSASLLESGRPARLRIHYLAYQDFGPLSVSVHITRSDGLTCCMLRSKLSSVTFSVERGAGTVEVTLDPLQLITGAYFAEGSFLNQADSMEIVSARSDWFQVRGRALSYEETSGVFEPRASWGQREEALTLSGAYLPGRNGAFSDVPTFTNSERDHRETRQSVIL